MADKKISALTASTTPLAGTEVLPIVQSGATVKVSVANLTAGRAVSASSLTASTDNIIIGTTAKGVTTGSAIPLGFGVNNTVTAMTIDTSGNIGIGTASPYAKVDIVGTNGDSIQYRTGARTIGMGVLSGVNALYAGTGTELTFYINGEHMRITGNGEVGIGTTTPAATAILDVQSTTKGVRFPNMTTGQKTAITPSAGTVVFDTTLSKLCVYSGATWETITSV